MSMLSILNYPCINVLLWNLVWMRSVIFCLFGEGMITGGAGATIFYNLKQRHPTLDMPVIDYDLALLFQPMLMLGISIGVAFNVIFPDWMLTALLIVVFIGMSSLKFEYVNMK